MNLASSAESQQGVHFSLPLRGVRVLAWEQAVAAPFASRQLADLGAEVIKIERPGIGDFARVNNRHVKGLSSYFVWANRGKRSVVLDLKTDEGREVFERLIEASDVLIHNQGPGVAERLSYGYESVAARNPALIYCAITGYGRSGPYEHRKAFDILVQGEGGLTAMTGTPEVACKPGASIADISAATYAFGSIMAALYARTSTGKGAEINISMLESLVEFCSPQAYSTMYTGKNPARVGSRHPILSPQGGYKCGDGHSVNIGVQNPEQWEILCNDVFLCPEMAQDPRFLTNQDRVESRAVLEPMIEECLASAPRAEVERRLLDAGIPFGSINEMTEVITHPQLEARDRWFDVESPAGPIRMMHHPFNIEGLERPSASIPAYGEHTAAVYAELGLEAPQTVFTAPEELPVS